MGVEMSSYSLLSISHHLCLHVTSPCMISRVPQEPEMKKIDFLIIDNIELYIRSFLNNIITSN